jgi:hypothetical protein
MLKHSQRILVLYWWYDGEMRAAVQHHLQALNYSETQHKVIYYNTLNGIPSWLGYLDFDAVIIHNTLLCWRWSTTASEWKNSLNWIRNLNCVKIAIPQDEYDHSEVLDEWLSDLGISAIFTNFDENYRQLLYPIMSNKATFYRCFTGYIDDLAAKQYADRLPSMKARLYDIVYRASHLPYWFGSHGQIKYEIADIVAQRALVHRLKCNISTRYEDTITGNQWFDFLASGKTIIGCESGSSVLDRRGEIQSQIQHLLKENPHLSFAEVSALMPAGWDDYRFFALSPRHFEAIITKTCQILVEGEYDGVLEADRHYIPLKRDFSNLDEVLEKVKDTNLLEEIAERAYQEIYLSGKYSYKSLAIALDNALLENTNKIQLLRILRVRFPWSWVESFVKLSQTYKIISIRKFLITGFLVFREALITGVLVLRKAPANIVKKGVKKGVKQVIKICVTLNLALTNSILRSILIHYLGDKENRKKVTPSNLIKDFWWLGIVKRTMTSSSMLNEPFRLVVEFNAETESIAFLSQPLGKNESQAVEQQLMVETHAEAEANWSIFEAALQKGVVKRIVLDHSAVGNSIRYPLTASKSFNVDMEPNGVYEFKGLAAVARCWSEKT